MKVQFQILLFMICLNLSVGLVLALELPGTEYVEMHPSTNTTDYESHFNATQIAEDWGATPFAGIPVIGDIFSGFQFLYRNFQYLVDGFPMFLDWVSFSFIGDADARASFLLIQWALRGVYAVSISIFVIEFISGRYMTD